MNSANKGMTNLIFFKRANVWRYDFGWSKLQKMPLF